MRKAIWTFVFVGLLSGCAFGHSKAQVESKLALPLATVGGDSFYASGTQEVVAVGPTMIPVLLEIVRDNREASIAWVKTHSEQDGRKVSIRDEAMSALGQLIRTDEDSVLVVPVLEAIARDEAEPQLSRSRAITALAIAGAPGGVDALARLFHVYHSKGDPKRFTVTSMLAATPDPKGREVLEELAGMDDPLVRKKIDSLKGAKPWTRPVVPVVEPGNNCGAAVATRPAGLGQVAFGLMLLVYLRARVRRRQNRSSLKGE